MRLNIFRIVPLSILNVHDVIINSSYITKTVLYIEALSVCFFDKILWRQHPPWDLIYLELVWMVANGERHFICWPTLISSLDVMFVSLGLINFQEQSHRADLVEHEDSNVAKLMYVMTSLLLNRALPTWTHGAQRQNIQ